MDSEIIRSGTKRVLTLSMLSDIVEARIAREASQANPGGQNSDRVIPNLKGAISNASSESTRKSVICGTGVRDLVCRRPNPRGRPPKPFQVRYHSCHAYPSS